MRVRQFAIPLILMIGAGAEAQAQSLSDGLQAYNQNRLAEARRIYEAVGVNPAAAVEDKAVAAQELARLAWLVDRDSDRALAHLATAQALGTRLCGTGIHMVRVLREAGQLDATIERGRDMIERCDDPARRDDIRLQMIKAMIEQSVADPARRSEHLAMASAEFGRLGADAAAGAEGSRVRMEIGLLTGDAEAALQGWRSYFWLVETDSPQALSNYDAAGLFRAGAPASASPEARVALAELLMKAGFEPQLRRFVAATGLSASAGDAPAWRLVSTYLEQRERLDALMLEVNRGIARTGRDAAYLDQVETRLEAEMRAIGGALLAGAGVTGAPGSAEEYQALLLRHYGMFGTGPGRTSGYPSLHYGHATGDRGSSASLYGHSVDVRFVEIDNMMANGFETWLWDGSAGAGGWASGRLIVGVRSGYTSHPVSAYSMVHDGPTRRRIIADQARLAQEDVAQLRTSPVTYLRGLGDRLRLQAVERVAAVARARMGAGGDFRRAFLDEWYRTVWHRSFDLHEARHILDGTLQVDDSAETVPAAGLEFRAKLTEVALTDYPRLALYGINDANMGDGSGHGQGNYRVMDLFRRWIEAHPTEVMGYDPAIPALAQLDKLTDEQMRAIARSADPLAQAEAGSVAGR